MTPPSWNNVRRREGDGFSSDYTNGGPPPVQQPQGGSPPPVTQPPSNDYGYTPSPTIRSPMPSPSSGSGGLFDNDGGLFDTEVIKPESPAPSPSPSASVDESGGDDLVSSSGPRPDNVEALKNKENAMFKKMEELVTPENIDGIAGTLKAYGVDMPTDQVKNILPAFMPLLAKYGNRVMGGENPEKFVELSASAAKITEFIKDIQPLIGAIIAAVIKPPTDAQGKVILRPEDEKNFDKLGDGLDNNSLSSFLQDGDSGQVQGASSAETGLPSDMKPSPKRMTYAGRGGAENASLYAANEVEPKKKLSGPFESIDDLMAKAQRDSPTFAKDMEAINVRDAKVNARPAAKEAGLPVKETPAAPPVVEEIVVPSPQRPAPRPAPRNEVVPEKDLGINDVQVDDDANLGMDEKEMALYDEPPKDKDKKPVVRDELDDLFDDEESGGR